MKATEYSQLTQKAWDDAAEEHKPPYRIPEQISEEQARVQFAKVTRTALFAIAYGYANHHRRSNGLGKLIQPPMPVSISNWIEGKISAVDNYMERPGADHYQTLVNGLLTHLRVAEHHFLGHGK